MSATAPMEARTAEPGVGAAPVNRMAIAVLSLVGVFISTYLLLHKLGVVGTLVCGTGSCETVQASPWAVFLGVPVPAWGVAGYGVLLAASFAGLRPALWGSRRLGLLLVVLGAGAFGFSAYLTAIEAFVIHAWCRWCVASAVVATLVFIFSLGEVVRPGSR
ncbi:MAG TPA: vitamin K epoxide reductase family protein [Longimicrobiales bacterium]